MVFTLLLFVLLGAQSLLAQPNKFSLERMRQIAGVSSLAPSPDGATVAVVVTRPNYADNINESELYAVEVRSGKTRQLTSGRKSVGEPHWSPDGSVLAFLAPDTAQRPQIWLMPMSGGDVRQLTTSVSGVAHFAWRPDGTAIAFAAEDEAPKLEGESRHLTTFQVGDQDIFLRTPLRPQHIWIIATEDSAKPERLTGGAWTLEFALPPGSAFAESLAGLRSDVDGAFPSFLEPVSR
jgi:dipeptidyl aminopeptidase/acylaminoacyl peptidase